MQLPVPHRQFVLVSKIEPPLQNEPQIRYLLLSEIRRLLDYLKVRQQGYGSALAFHLANALFQTACRFEELIQLTWSDCQRVGEEIVALRIKGKGSVFQDVPVPGRLSAALLEWKVVQEGFKGRRILAPDGIASPSLLSALSLVHDPTRGNGATGDVSITARQGFFDGQRSIVGAIMLGD